MSFERHKSWNLVLCLLSEWNILGRTRFQVRTVGRLELLVCFGPVLREVCFVLRVVGFNTWQRLHKDTNHKCLSMVVCNAPSQHEGIKLENAGWVWSPGNLSYSLTTTQVRIVENRILRLILCIVHCRCVDIIGGGDMATARRNLSQFGHCIALLWGHGLTMFKSKFLKSPSVPQNMERPKHGEDVGTDVRRGGVDVSTSRQSQVLSVIIKYSLSRPLFKIGRAHV